MFFMANHSEGFIVVYWWLKMVFGGLAWLVLSWLVGMVSNGLGVRDFPRWRRAQPCRGSVFHNFPNFDLPTPSRVAWAVASVQHESCAELFHPATLVCSGTEQLKTCWEFAAGTQRASTAAKDLALALQQTLIHWTGHWIPWRRPLILSHPHPFDFPYSILLNITHIFGGLWS